MKSILCEKCPVRLPSLSLFYCDPLSYTYFHAKEFAISCMECANSLVSISFHRKSKYRSSFSRCGVRLRPTPSSFALWTCAQKREEAAHVRKIWLLRALLIRTNQQIPDLERSIAELREQRHLDVIRPVSTDADPISAIFVHELKMQKNPSTDEKPRLLEITTPSPLFSPCCPPITPKMSCFKVFHITIRQKVKSAEKAAHR
jgi:hypothetical protein